MLFVFDMRTARELDVKSIMLGAFRNWLSLKKTNNMKTAMSCFWVRTGRKRVDQCACAT